MNQRDRNDPTLREVLASAAHLQTLVPDAILVGGTAAAHHAGHRLSVDHDHVVADLKGRFDLLLDALESDPDFVFNRAVPGTIMPGRWGDIGVGVRQLIRARPVELEEVELPDGTTVRVPTIDEALRIKACLIVKRNQVRDYLGVAVLAHTMGVETAARVLAGIDACCTDPHGSGEPVRSQLTRQLGQPRPHDAGTIGELPTYKGLLPAGHDREVVVGTAQAVAAHMIDLAPPPPGETEGVEQPVALAFRNIAVGPSAPVEEWGLEGLLAAVDRGEAGDWRRIGAVVRREPWGPVARRLEDEVLQAAADSGVASALRGMIALQRERTVREEREEVRRELASLVRASGLSQGAFARRLGTSRTRVNTYLSGKVVPSAATLVRARRVCEAVRHRGR